MKRLVDLLWLLLAIAVGGAMILMAVALATLAANDIW